MSACDRGRLKMSTQKSACLDTQIFVHEQFIIAIDWYTGLNQFLTEGNPKILILSSVHSYEPFT